MLASAIRVLMLVICFGVVWPSHAGLTAPAAKTTEAGQLSTNIGVNSATGSIMPTLVSQQLGQSASFDRFFATAHDVRLEQPEQTTEFLLTLSQVSASDFADLSQVDAVGADTDLPSNKNQHSSHSRSFDLAIATSSRFLSLLRHDPDDVEPCYQLAIELPVAPVPSFAKDYRVDMEPMLDWTLKTVPSAGRISGWKESNLTYTVYHHLLSLV